MKKTLYLRGAARNAARKAARAFKRAEARVEAALLVAQHTAEEKMPDGEAYRESEVEAWHYEVYAAWVNSTRPNGWAGEESAD